MAAVRRSARVASRTDKLSTSYDKPPHHPNKPIAPTLNTPRPIPPKPQTPDPFENEGLHIQVPLYVKEKIVLPTREYLWHVLDDPPYIGCNKLHIVDLFELMYWRRLKNVPLPHDADGVSQANPKYNFSFMTPCGLHTSHLIFYSLMPSLVATSRHNDRSRNHRSLNGANTGYV